jgi:hypothetical protein
MQGRESTTLYYASDKRYIGNAIQVFFKDGSHTSRVQRSHGGAGGAGDAVKRRP